MHKMFRFCVFLAVFSLSTVVWSQQVLDNAAVLKLQAAGLSEALILQTINASAGHYDTSTDSLIALKKAGLTDKVIAAMLAKNAGPSAPSKPVYSFGPKPINPSTDGKVRLYYAQHEITAQEFRMLNTPGYVAPTQKDYPTVDTVASMVSRKCPANVMVTSDPSQWDYSIVFSLYEHRSSLIKLPSKGVLTHGVAFTKSNQVVAFSTRAADLEAALGELCKQLPVGN